jgi:hypothetical protein
VPAAQRGSAIRVLRLTRAGSRLTALLLAGTGRTAVLLAAWTAGGPWTLSAALPVPAGVTSSSLGPDGAVAVTLGRRGAAVLPAPAGTASAPGWQSLPALPSDPHVTLALLAPGVVQALGTNRSVLTVWQLGAGGWTWVQRTTIPIQYGSST